VINPNRLH
jgi:hypothetical protein